MGRFPTPRNRRRPTSWAIWDATSPTCWPAIPRAGRTSSDDLLGFADLTAKPAAEAPIRELASQVLAAAVATKPSEAAAAPLLEQLYVAISARQLSEGQIKALEENVQAAASRMGLDDVKARALSAQAGIVQQAVTERHRRWYEVF